MLSTISNINLMRKPVAAITLPENAPATYWLAFGPGTNSIKKTDTPKIIFFSTRFLCSQLQFFNVSKLY